MSPLNHIISILKSPEGVTAYSAVGSGNGFHSVNGNNTNNNNNNDQFMIDEDDDDDDDDHNGDMEMISKIRGGKD